MSDIVERLEKWARFGYGFEASMDMGEAADTITTLRARVAELEKALRVTQPALQAAGLGGRP